MEKEKEKEKEENVTQIEVNEVNVVSKTTIAVSESRGLRSCSCM